MIGIFYLPFDTGRWSIAREMIDDAYCVDIEAQFQWQLIVRTLLNLLQIIEIRRRPRRGQILVEYWS
jgi:hypothetical protein